MADRAQADRCFYRPAWPVAGRAVRRLCRLAPAQARTISYRQPHGWLQPERQLLKTEAPPGRACPPASHLVVIRIIMNKNLYRIIFNKRRGQLMVVAEHASSQGKAARGEGAVQGEDAAGVHARLRPLALAVFGALGMVMFVSGPVMGQILADPNAPGKQRPTVLQSANGVTQVNIQTPSAAGVSRNTYSQFDVTANGAILNNSRGNVQTQTGGWVQGNPWLAGGGARVILNEVNSANPSQLRGYVEVAGQRAEVIIANPAGIQVDGGGFINASRATLTTCTPVINNGSLDAFRVQGGAVNVLGAGLDARTADYTHVLARAVQLNAGIWAKD